MHFFCIIDFNKIASLIDRKIEKILVITLSGLALSIFVSKTGVGFFGLSSLLLMLKWRFAEKYKWTNRLPRILLALTIFFLLDLLVSAILSDNHSIAFHELTKHRHLFIGGLLFLAPMAEEDRKKIITVFFIGAALDGLTGILQHFDILQKGAYDQPHGLASHPIQYALNLSFICGSAILMLLMRRHIESKKYILFLIVTISLTLGAIVLTMSRGAWLAFFIAFTIVIFLYDRKKARAFLFVMIPIFFLVFSLNDNIKKRAFSIVTSFYTESETGSVGNRLELWKGALLIFKQSPVFGTGYGDFELDIKKLISEKKLKPISSTVYAHNIFFQALATRGIIGLALLVSFFVVLLKWGLREIETRDSIGGYVIILSTLITIVGGLSENDIEISKFLIAYCFTLGLIGPFGAKVLKTNNGVGISL